MATETSAVVLAPGGAEPAGFDDVQPRCDLCGLAQALEGEDWNGETGNHYSCEPRRWTRNATGQIMFDGRPLFLLVRAQWGEDYTPAATLYALERRIVALLNADGAGA